MPIIVIKVYGIYSCKFWKLLISWQEMNKYKHLNVHILTSYKCKIPVLEAQISLHITNVETLNNKYNYF